MIRSGLFKRRMGLEILIVEIFRINKGKESRNIFVINLFKRIGKGV